MVQNVLSGKAYIGVSKGNLHRLQEHREGIKSNEHLQNAIRRYGVENFRFESIEEWDTCEEALQAEHDIIVYLKAMGAVLYNKTDGGRGCLNPSPETRMKMRLAKLGERSHRWGKKDSEETKTKRAKSVSKALTGRKRGPHSPEWNEKIRQSNLGLKRIITEKMREAHRLNGERMRGKPTPMNKCPPWNKGKKTGPMDPDMVRRRAERIKDSKRSEHTKTMMKASARLREARKRFRKMAHRWLGRTHETS
jgi:predicted GIY-YIG superfamily endonuclease